MKQNNVNTKKINLYTKADKLEEKYITNLGFHCFLSILLKMIKPITILFEPLFYMYICCS